jgi:hypothetical protein
MIETRKKLIKVATNIIANLRKVKVFQDTVSIYRVRSKNN